MASGKNSYQPQLEENAMRKLVFACLLFIVGFASAEPMVGNISILNGGQVFYWSDTGLAATSGFVEPITLGPDESFVGIKAHSKRLCFASSTTIGYYTPGVNVIVVPNTANNDKDLYYSGVIKNNTTNAVREVSVLIDNWDEDLNTSLPWNIAPDSTVSYGIKTGNYQQPTISYEGGSVVVRFNADVISGFLAQGVPACNMSPNNIKTASMGIDGVNPIIGNITQENDQNYTITFPGVVNGTTFTIKLVMYKNDEDRWLDMSFFEPGDNITFNSNGTLTAH